MAAKKVYAVKKGLITGIFETWEECKGAVDGFSGAEYKSFKTREEAYAYLGMECPDGVECLPDEFPKEADMLVTYVDGSYEHSLLKYAFGCVFLLPDRRILTEKGSGN